MMMSLVEQDLCGGGIRYYFDLVRRDNFATGWKVGVKVDVGMYNTRGGRSRSGRWIVERRRLGLDAITLAS